MLSDLLENVLPTGKIHINAKYQVGTTKHLVQVAKCYTQDKWKVNSTTGSGERINHIFLAGLLAIKISAYRHTTCGLKLVLVTCCGAFEPITLSLIDILHIFRCHWTLDFTLHSWPWKMQQSPLKVYLLLCSAMHWTTAHNFFCENTPFYVNTNNHCGLTILQNVH